MMFLVDMPLSPGLAAWLKKRGHDAVHAAELGLHRAPDIGILDRAKQEYRTIITADLDYPRPLALARATDPSFILFPDGYSTDPAVFARMSEVFTSLPPPSFSPTIAC